MGAQVKRVVITDLVDNTFYAVIELLKEGELVFFDSRPSDAIALALRSDSPIYVNETVIKNSRNTVTEKTSATTDKGELDDEEEIQWPDEIDDSDIEYRM
jgi:uncharacterized protein